LNTPYPTMEQVAKAGQRQLAKWNRFLPAAGNLDEIMIGNAIAERFQALGGWNPKLSKDIGWVP